MEDYSKDKKQYLDAHYRLFFSQFSQAVPAVVALLGLSIYNFQSYVPAYLLYPWGGLILLMYFLRSRIKHAYDKAHKAGQDRQVDWGYYIKLGSFVTGLFWGLGALFALFDVNVEAMMFLIVVVTILVTGNAVTHAAIESASIYFSTPALLPYVVVFLFQGEILEIEIGVALLLLYVTMLRQTGFINKMVSRNIDLSDDYLQSIQELEEANRSSVKLIANLEREIKEKENAERQLKDIESHYILAEQLAGFGHLHWDIDANKTYISKEAGKILYGEYEEKTAIGDIYSYLSKIAHPDDYTKLYSAIDYAIQNQIHLDQKFRRISNSGEIWLQIKGETIVDADDKKLFCAVIRDVSSDIVLGLRLEQNIASVHALSRESHTLMAQIDEAVIKIGAEGNIEHINPKMSEILGLEEGAVFMLIGIPILNLVDSKARDSLNQVISSCEPAYSSLRFEHKSMAEGAREVDIHLIPLCQDNVYIGMLLISK